MDSLTPEQQALFASIMGNSSQAKANNPEIPKEEPKTQEAPAPDANKVLTQAEIDALIASMSQ